MFWFLISIFFIALILLTVFSFRFLFEKKSAQRFSKIIIGINLLIFLLMLLGFIFKDSIPKFLVTTFGNLSTIALMTQLICSAMVSIAAIVRWGYKKLIATCKFEPARRNLLLFQAFYPAASFFVTLYGNQFERNTEIENFYDIPIKNLSSELVGIEIAQISDIHLGAFFSLERLEFLLQKIADRQPDLLVITGDIFDDIQMNAEAISLIDKFTKKFRFGIYYCHGNHEHFRGIEKIEKMLAQTKINWLVNDSRNVLSNLFILGVDYPPNSPITSVGNDEKHEKKFKTARKIFLDKAAKDIPDEAICILLAHHPEFIDDGVERNFPLTLTGHTHGGQFGFLGEPLFPIFKYTRGLIKFGDNFGYVHVGNGSWFPIRLGCTPEIAYFTLKAI